MIITFSIGENLVKIAEHSTIEHATRHVHATSVRRKFRIKPTAIVTASDSRSQGMTHQDNKIFMALIFFFWGGGLLFALFCFCYPWNFLMAVFVVVVVVVPSRLTDARVWFWNFLLSGFFGVGQKATKKIVVATTSDCRSV